MASKLDDQANRLKVLRKSGRDKYVSFFAVLNEVRAEIGDKALPDWCIDELRIPLRVIVETGKVLSDADAVRTDLKRVETHAKKAQEGHSPHRRAEAQLVARLPDAAAAKRVRELEAQVAALKAANAEAPGRPAPKRDRRDYMREFIRRKRAAER